jgi:hypothetical protein
MLPSVEALVIRGGDLDPFNSSEKSCDCSRRS